MYNTNAFFDSTQNITTSQVFLNERLQELVTNDILTEAKAQEVMNVLNMNNIQRYRYMKNACSQYADIIDGTAFMRPAAPYLFLAGFVGNETHSFATLEDFFALDNSIKNQLLGNSHLDFITGGYIGNIISFEELNNMDLIEFVNFVDNNVNNANTGVTNTNHSI